MQGWTATQGMELQKKKKKMKSIHESCLERTKKNCPLILEPFRLLCQRKAVCR